MRVCVVPANIVAVVACDKRNAQFPGNGVQLCINRALLRNPMIGQFEKKTVGPENLAISLRPASGVIEAIVKNERGNIACEAATEADDVGGILFEQFVIDARLVIEPFGKARRGDRHEIAVSGV